MRLAALVVASCITLAAYAEAPLNPPVQTWFPKAPPLPAPSGQVIRVATVDELFRAAPLLYFGFFRFFRFLLAEGQNDFIPAPRAVYRHSFDAVLPCHHDRRSDILPGRFLRHIDRL